jgi:HipA-like protein
MMRKAEIKFNEYTAGWLTQDENGFHFIYHKAYLVSDKPVPVSLTLPLQEGTLWFSIQSIPFCYIFILAMACRKDLPTFTPEI